MLATTIVFDSCHYDLRSRGYFIEQVVCMNNMYLNNHYKSTTTVHSDFSFILAIIIMFDLCHYNPWSRGYFIEQVMCMNNTYLDNHYNYRTLRFLFMIATTIMFDLCHYYLWSRGISSNRLCAWITRTWTTTTSRRDCTVDTMATLRTQIMAHQQLFHLRPGGVWSFWLRQTSSDLASGRIWTTMREGLCCLVERFAAALAAIRGLWRRWLLLLFAALDEA